METKILVLVDVQNDFITGSLGTTEAQKALKNICKMIHNFNYFMVSLDTHGENYSSTLEGRNLPVEHCIVNTPGWQMPKELELKNCVERFYTKETFGNLLLINDLKEVCESHHCNDIHIMGFCTDICVITNALMIKTIIPESNIFVYADCCAGTSIENHERALRVMESCQINKVYSGLW